MWVDGVGLRPLAFSARLSSCRTTCSGFETNSPRCHTLRWWSGERACELRGRPGNHRQHRRNRALAVNARVSAAAFAQRVRVARFLGRPHCSSGAGFARPRLAGSPRKTEVGGWGRERLLPVNRSPHHQTTRLGYFGGSEASVVVRCIAQAGSGRAARAAGGRLGGRHFGRWQGRASDSSRNFEYVAGSVDRAKIFG